MKYIYLYIAILIFTTGKSQNIVPNSGFEIMNTSTVGVVCPTGGNPNYYYQCLDNWYNPISGIPSGSPDLFSHNCSIQCGIPYNRFGTQIVKNGDFYAGIGTYMRNYFSTQDYKEYISVKLTDTLKAGKMYCFNMYVSLADSSKYLANPLSVLFTNSDVSITNNAGPLPYTPQLDFVVPNDTSNWVNLLSSFVAVGGETFMTIGSFRDSANMQLTVSNPQSTYKLCYFYIDDVSLEEVSTSCTNSINELATNYSIEVFPNPTNGILNLKMLNVSKDVKIKITDVLGREVLVSNYKEQIDISQLEIGIYFVSVIQGNTTLVTQKVIKG